jgi:hypothetical protein
MYIRKIAILAASIMVILVCGVSYCFCCSTYGGYGTGNAPAAARPISVFLVTTSIRPRCASYVRPTETCGTCTSSGASADATWTETPFAWTLMGSAEASGHRRQPTEATSPRERTPPGAASDAYKRTLAATISPVAPLALG